ncbi:NAD(P)/FAD-dependent oxidoreductase [Actinomadura gamaensis]|uniref:NAD(P)/FAD-dependent oxidoreductase n=1 Tax=Actinomadura gamaensis TaxID=1763541 RepID=A0ABV9UD89_9ACTN
MPDVLVLGGGFAGVWSAAGAARLLGGDRVTLVSASDDMVIRPRLYEARPGDKRVPLDRVLRPIGVRRHAAHVTDVDTVRRRVTVIAEGRESELGYERLVLATGSRLVRPSMPGAEWLHDVDTLDSAIALDAHLHALPDEPGEGRFTAVVVGAGFTGLEVATELVGRLRDISGDAEQVRVVLVERAPDIGPELGPGPRPAITAALDELGIERHLGATVEKVERRGVRLSDGTWIAARTVVWTAGVQASPLTRAVPGDRDRIGRLVTDEYLRVRGVTGVYAAGDTAAAPADETHTVMPSCQHALQLGRHAGHNVAADLLGIPLVPFTPDPYVVCLDLGDAGAVTARGWDRIVHTTGAVAKARKQQVNTQWIYPPLDDAEEILRRADYRVSTRPTSSA